MCVCVWMHTCMREREIMHIRAVLILIYYLYYIGISTDIMSIRIGQLQVYNTDISLELYALLKVVYCTYHEKCLTAQSDLL